MSSEVHRLFLKHLEFSTTSKQLADALTNEGHGDGLVHIRIVRKGSHFPGKTCNAFVTTSWRVRSVMLLQDWRSRPSMAFASTHVKLTWPILATTPTPTIT